MNAIRSFAIATLAVVIAAPAFAESASRTRLLTAPNPAHAGEAVQLRAEVDGLFGGAPKGTVNFSDGSAALGSATLSPFGAGQATLAGGGDHSCALSAAGGVKCWGWNYNGQIGDGSTKNRLTPSAVQGLPNDIVAITTGGRHSCALTSAGAVKCWGYNGDGELGDGTYRTRLTPVDVSGLSAGAVAITTGGGHSCALTSAGAVKCWGHNVNGGLGDGTRQSRFAPVSVSGLSGGVVAITAGGYHSCALTSAGAVKCWGANDFGQLGDRTLKDRLTPVRVSGLTSGVAAITTGAWHSCALTSAGAVKCWGWNLYRQLGDGSLMNRLIPVSVSGLSGGVVAIAAGGAHSCALTTASAGAVKCWGDNEEGAIGDGTGVNRSVPTRVLRLTALVRSRAQLSTQSLGVGTHSLEAAYPGSAFHLPSSGFRSQTIIP